MPVCRTLVDIDDDDDIMIAYLLLRYGNKGVNYIYRYMVLQLLLFKNPPLQNCNSIMWLMGWFPKGSELSLVDPFNQM